ncbi:protein-(Glutamine-N5) methyltransferase release factor-specific [Prevotella sp. CAG:487]|nr:protein-(Glutamine-N5) methyltransferase release factor-specific [Prevotella sp. CAG:487]
MTYRELWNTLTPVYGEREAKSVARLVFEQRFGLDMTDICIGKDKQLSEETHNEMKKIAARLLQNEPVQYVLGYETFCGRTFTVRPGVLIPRPETEGLIQLMRSLGSREKPAPRILDIGTGSGCIAITAALDMAGADVTAWDISEEALATAEENASTLGARVRFVRQDALRPPVRPPPACGRGSVGLRGEQSAIHMHEGTRGDEPQRARPRTCHRALRARRRPAHVLPFDSPLRTARAQRRRMAALRDKPSV